MVLAEQGGAAGEEALDRWSTVMRGGSVWEVLGGVAVEGDVVPRAARPCVVAGCWAAALDPRVGGRRWGDKVVKRR